MDINRFMQENNIAILAEAQEGCDIFHMYKRDIVLESYDLFLQLVLHSNASSLSEYTDGQLLPRIWSQGAAKCVMCKPSDSKIVCMFYDSSMSAKEHYLYAKELSEKAVELFREENQ